MLVGCTQPGHDRKSEWAFADLPAPGAVTTESPVSIALVESARYGTLDGEASIGRVDAVAASSDHVVVVDGISCELIVFARGSGNVLRRLGGCGGGPGEFNRIMSVELHGDGLLVLDERGRRARLISLEGEERWRLDLVAAGLPVGIFYHYASLLGDSAVLVSAGLPPASEPQDPAQAGRRYPDHYVTLVSTRSGGGSTQFLRDGPAVVRHEHETVREVAGCVLRDRSEGAPARFVAMSQWAPQVVSVPLDGSNSPDLNILFEDVPLRPHLFTGPGRKRWSTTGVLRGACSDSVALFSWSYRKDPESEYRDAAYLIAVWPAAGRHAVLQVVDEPVALLSPLRAASGDSFYFSSDSRFGYPIRTYHLIAAKDRRPRVGLDYATPGTRSPQRPERIRCLVSPGCHSSWCCSHHRSH